MAQYIKGSIAYMTGIDQINRKFALKKNKCSAKWGGPVRYVPMRFIGGATRNTIRGVIGACRKNYMFMRMNARVTPPSVHEIDLRNKFSTIRAAIIHLMEDLTQVTRIQAMWLGGTIAGKYYEGARNNANIKINGVSAEGYTYYGWLFAVQYAGLKASSEYNVNQFPTDYDA